MLMTKSFKGQVEVADKVILVTKLGNSLLATSKILHASICMRQKLKSACLNLKTEQLLSFTSVKNSSLMINNVINKTKRYHLQCRH